MDYSNSRILHLKDIEYLKKELLLQTLFTF